MKTKKIEGYNIIYEGDGPIPALITGPAEIFIKTFTDEIKEECTLFGVNYPWRRKSQDLIDSKYRPQGWRNMTDVIAYYYHVAKLFCSYLNKEKCLAIGPSILAALADKLTLDYPNFFRGACLLSPISLVAVSGSDLAKTIIQEENHPSLIPDDNTNSSFLSFDDSKIETTEVTSAFYYYLDTLRKDSDKDFKNETVLRPKWIELWEEGSDNVETISFLLNVLSHYPLGTAKTPVLMISGEQDGRYPVNLAKTIHATNYYEHVIMPGGHATHFEFQNEFTDVFIVWLIETGLKKPEPKITQRTKDLRKAYELLEQEIKIRKRIERNLRESENHFRLLSEMAPVGIFRMDIYGRSLYTNARFKQITGLQESLINHEDWIEKIHPEDQLRIKEKFYYCINHQLTFNAEYRFMHNNGMIVWVQGQIIPEFSNDGFYNGTIGTLTDITSQRDTEEQLRQHQAELAHFSRINTAGEMISGLAHEINQPLSSIVQFMGGCIAYLSRMDTPKDILQVLHDTEKEAERAGMIIERLRNFVKKGKIQKRWFPIDEIINGTLNIMHHDIQAEEINIQYIPHPCPLEVCVDKIQIEQVFVNVIRNSIDALREITPKKRGIKITVTANDSILQVKISDTGVGMRAEQLDNLFNPFYTTKPEGMGIGLSISNTIMRAHGGSLAADSKIGKGTTMVLELSTIASTDSRANTLEQQSNATVLQN